MLLNYKEFGEGKPLIIMHGLFGASDNWQTIGKKLAEDYRVILPDLRNHGNSFHSSAFDYDVMADDLKNLITHLNFEKPFVAGHSMGGKVAMNYAIHFPESIEKLIVVDIAPKSYPPHHEPIINALQSLNLTKLKTRTEAEKELGNSINDTGLRQFLLKNLSRNENGQFEWRINLPVIKEKLVNITGGLVKKGENITESLFLRGQKSDYIKEEDFKLIKDFFPKSEIKTVENAGHLTHAEQPEVVYNYIINFLRR
jgi:esterase